MIGAKDNIYENVIHHLQEETMTCVLLRQHVSIERARNNNNNKTTRMEGGRGGG